MPEATDQELVRIYNLVMAIIGAQDSLMARLNVLPDPIPESWTGLIELAWRLADRD